MDSEGVGRSCSETEATRRVRRDVLSTLSLCLPACLPLSLCLSTCVSFSLDLSISLCFSLSLNAIPSCESVPMSQHRWQAHNWPPPFFMRSRQPPRLCYVHRFAVVTTCRGRASVRYLPVTITYAGVRQTFCLTSRNALYPFTSAFPTRSALLSSSRPEW